MGGCSAPDEPAIPKGDGAWLLVSEDNLNHDSAGLALIVIRKGDEQSSLNAPYKVNRHGFGGATVTLSTSCGDLPILGLKDGEAAPSNSTAFAPDSNSIPNCGLGEKLMRAGSWHLRTNWKA